MTGDCRVKWCDLDNHYGEHVAFVDSTAIRGARGHSVTVNVLLVGGPQKSARRVEVVLDDGRTLTLRPAPGQLGSLAKMLERVAR